ncbi:MAG TPA: hypothetical protein VK489_02645, partial [Ferruginibacter sp.]|nr:hypothetical protein [Ferruginibacter sp.]
MKSYSYARRHRLPFFLLTFMLAFSQLSLGQLAAGFTVNGQAVVEGDTINVCRTKSLSYTSTAIGFTTINWQFHLGTPASSGLPNPPLVFYNTNGIDSTIQVVSDG